MSVLRVLGNEEAMRLLKESPLFSEGRFYEKGDSLTGKVPTKLRRRRTGVNLTLSSARCGDWREQVEEIHAFFQKNREALEPLLFHEGIYSRVLDLKDRLPESDAEIANQHSCIPYWLLGYCSELCIDVSISVYPCN
jgi:hypothetical protein